MSDRPTIPPLPALCAILVLFASLIATSAAACTTANWQASNGAVNPQDPNNSVARVNGYCGLELADTGYVQDGSPSAEASFVGHFYFLPDFSGSGSVDIFIAYSDEAATSPAIVIRYDGNNLILDATAIGGGTASLAAKNSGWNLVEFAWQSGSQGDFWVNTDAASVAPGATFTPGDGSIEAVRLGAPNGFGGFTGRALFDEYVSNRSQAVGELLYGDANQDGTVDSTDMDLLVDEFLNANLAFGVVDCNLDGNIDAGDADCMAGAL